MRTYEVQAGDSPAQIAIRFAGCPKCAVDLVRANPHKPTVTYPNGFATFRTINVGEILNLPDKWFNGQLDAMPPAYFANLPYADGVTRGALGVGLEDLIVPSGLDAAAAAIAALAAMDNVTFSNAVGAAGTALSSAVQSAYGSSVPAAASAAQNVQNGAQWAWQRNRDLAAALASGNQTDIAAARLDIQNALTTALGNARIAMQAYLAGQPSPPAVSTAITSAFSSILQMAAQTASAAMAADPNGCASVAQPGSAANIAVHNFKTAWNASQSPKVPIGTGTYEAATAVALAQVLGTAPPACGAGATIPVYSSLTQPQPQGLSIAAIVGIGVLGAAAIGAGAYYATRNPKGWQPSSYRARRGGWQFAQRY